MKLTFTHAKSRKTERGHALAFFGLAIAGLAGIIGLVVHVVTASLTEQNLQVIADEATPTVTVTLTPNPCEPTITPTLTPVCFDCGDQLGLLTSPSCPSTPTQTATVSATSTSTITATPTITTTLTLTPCEPAITPTLMCFDCGDQTGLLTSPSCPTKTPTRTSTRTPTRTPTRTATPLRLTFKSVAAQDGWILESSEASFKGGWLNSSSGSFAVGDDNGNRQYRSILSFNTASLPDNAIIQSALIRIRYSALVGSNPFPIMDGFWMQVKQGFFNNNSALELADFNAAPSSTMLAGTIYPQLNINSWYSAALTTTGQTYLNRTGTTQFRLYFAIDDNNNHFADNIRFLTGESLLNPPELVITYTLP